MIQNLNFITSTSFWCLVVIAIIGVLQTQGIISVEIQTAIDTILWAIVGVRAKNQLADAVSSK